MRSAAKPANEAKRLEALERYKVLDTLKEQTYSDITKLASSICGVEIAAISLIDQDRQWFKAITGLSATETPRDIAFCAHAILQPQTMIVPDALQDERFHDNPLVADGPKIRFYAGTPLQSSDGFMLGTLCVIDSSPKQLTQNQLEALEALSRQVMCLLEHRIDMARLNEVSQELQVARDHALELLEAKSNFFASVSHEFRTPMVGILGMAEHLKNLNLNNEQNDCMESIESSSKSILNIVNDILDSAKIDAGKFTIESHEFDLGRTLREIETIYRVETKKRNLNFLVQTQDLPAQVRGDSLRIRQILLNFLSNALKFTTDGTIKIGVVSQNLTEGLSNIRFEVSDSGIGLSIEQIGMMFQEYSQGDVSTARTHCGTGLGLSISKRLVELMGGQIGVTSQPGQGSKFWFELNLETVSVSNSREMPSAASKIEAGFSKSEAATFRILVADDNETNRKVISRSLKFLGFEVTVVKNGFEALEALHKDRFDTVLMDCQMPEMDSYEATMQIRSLPTNYQNIPIIAITANTEPGDRARTRLVGMNDFVSKPFTREKIIAKLSYWLGPESDKNSSLC